MLKKIRVDQLQLGMQVHALCGSWLDHPFWTKNFLLRDPGDLQKLRDSDLTECWIDTDRGADLPAAQEAPAATALTDAAAASSAARPPSTTARAALAPPAPLVSIESEAAQAALLCHRSKAIVEALFGDVRMGRALDAEKCLVLVDDISSSVWRNPDALISLARLKTHDTYSYMHSVAVCALMVSLARGLGQDEAEARDAGLAGLLHDIGKAVMPLAVLNKPGALTVEEYAVMRTHPQRGCELLAEGRHVNAAALDVCGHHHERPDGQGYPHRLAGADLSLQARMGAVCDVYDAITSNRPYKEGWDPAQSIARMSEWSKEGQFDPAVFQAFVDSIGIYPVGSLVRLQSGRLGVVIEQNPKSAITPRVKVFFSARSKLPVALEVIDLGRPGCVERIVARESNDLWQFPHLPELLVGHESLRKAQRAAGRSGSGVVA